MEKISLTVGVIGHEGSTVVVILNGLRLLAAPTQSTKHLIFESLSRFEPRHVINGRCRNVFQGFAREECLMAGDDHVRKSEEPAEHVVADDQTGPVLEKDLFLLFVHVQSQSAKLAAF